MSDMTMNIPVRKSAKKPKITAVKVLAYVFLIVLAIII